VVITLRQEPGVLREWGTFDALLYNLMTMNLAVMFTVPFLTAVAFCPRGSLPGAIVIAGLFCCAEAMVYAFLASSMPRSGGDHYFQSRLVSPVFGTIFAFTGVVLGGALWMAIAGWFAANVAVGPLFFVLGRLFGNDGFTRAAAFVQSSQGTLLLSLVVIVWSAAINIWGMRAYALLQKLCWVVGGLALLVVVVLVWRLGAPALGSSTAYQVALARARGLGFDPAGGAGPLAGTFALVPVAAFSLIYPAWSVQQAGEVRRAGRLRSQMVTIVVAEAITVALSAITVAAVLANVNREGLAAGAYLFFTHRGAMPNPSLPFFWFFDGSLWPSGCAVLCLCVLFNAWFWMWVPDITLAASRVLSSMSFDRSLPRWLGDEWGRHRVPAKGIALFSAVCLVPATLYAYTSLWRLTLSATLLNVLAFAVTCGAAAGLPYLHREIYRESTAARFEFLSVPVITWCGGAFCAFSGFLVWRFATDRILALGAPKWMLMSFVAAVYVVAYVVHVLANRLRRSRKDSELEVTYRLIT
jgi:basic amino acid/polyamine antiporter, APA family